MPQDFRCILVTPDQQVLDEQVTYASLPGWDGQVGVMHQRAALLIKLGDGALRLDCQDGGSRWFFVGGGFAQMKGNKLSLITDEAVSVNRIAKQDVQASLKQAQARIPLTQEEFQQNQRDLTRARAMLDLLKHRGQ